MAYTDLVPTFELCASLDELNWTQDTTYYWFNTQTIATGPFVVSFGQPSPEYPGFTHAPISSDFPQLPAGYSLAHATDDSWYAEYNGQPIYYGNTGQQVKQPRMIDCQADLWLYLQQN